MLQNKRRETLDKVFSSSSQVDWKQSFVKPIFYIAKQELNPFLVMYNWRFQLYSPLLWYVT